jgi:pimeloyl-ACP methyl ester carboxylesterase
MTRFRTLSWGSEALPAVVCLHGVCGHARRFERLARMLDGERHVIAYDLRGHGRSPWSGRQTLDQHVDDLAEVIDASGVDQTVLLGHSLGGRIAVEYAADHGERVTGLVLLDPPLFPPGRLLRDYAQAERSAGAYGSVDEAIEEALADGGLEHTPRALLEEEMAEHLVADEDGRFRLRYSREAAAQALEALADAPPPRLKEIVCPTLLVRAECSELLSEEDADQAAAELRRCTCRVVPGGHSVLWDSLAETGALVREFLLAGIRA